MSDKIFFEEGASALDSQIGATIDALTATIRARRDAGEGSYTFRLLSGDLDALLKKVSEEAFETALAAKDADRADADPREIDHLRYEAADVVYHLLVLLERFGIPIDEFAAELNSRMTDEERPRGGAMLLPEYVNRGRHGA